MHELVNRLVRRFDDINKPFVRLDHKILAAIPIDKRAPGNIVMSSVRGKRYRSHDASTRPHGGIQNLLTTVVYDPAVIRF